MSKKVNRQGCALITGAAKRIGKAISLALASQGYDIALHYNQSQADAEETAELIRNCGMDCQLFPCDLSDMNNVSSLIKHVHEKYNDLNLLVNNASIFEPSSIKDSDMSVVSKHFSVNFYAPYALSSQFAKICQKGNIINILDTNIAQHKTRYAAYLLSKKALNELTKQSAVELAPNIRVNGIAPGLILPSVHTNNDQLERMANNVPTKTRGNTDQITYCIQFLLENTYITGEVIFNDGGEHLT